MRCVEIEVERNPVGRNVARREVECDGVPRIVFSLYPTTHGSGVRVKISVAVQQYEERDLDIEYVVKKALNSEITTSDVHMLASKLDEDYDYVETRRAAELTLIINPS